MQLAVVGENEEMPYQECDSNRMKLILLQNTLVMNTQRSPIQSDLHVSDMDSVGHGSPRLVPQINEDYGEIDTAKNRNANVEYFSAPSERKEDETKIEEDNKILESLAEGNIQ